MDVARLRSLLDEVRAGRVDLDEALHALRDLPFADLGYATVDHHRALRQGAPEVILGQGKTCEQISGVARELVRAGQNVLVTRIDPDQAEHLAREFPHTRYVPIARVARIEVDEVGGERSRSEQRTLDDANTGKWGCAGHDVVLPRSQDGQTVEFVPTKHNT